MEPPILELKNVSVSYGHHKILDDISFSLEKGDTLAIIGPNGSGKTTLLKAILNIIPYQGEILKNQDIKIGYTPQKLDIERDLPLTINEFLNLYSVRNSIPLDKSRTFLRGIKPRRKDSNNTRSSPQQAAEYFGKVRDLFLERDGTALFGNMLAGAGHLLAAVILFQNGIAANLIHINFAWILSLASLFSYRFFSVKKEKREIKNLFSKYVSRDVLAEILRNPGKVSLGGEEKEITILFCDIRGFTALSEQTTPRELVSLLNRYFSAMTEKILEKGGVLDKYIGDAIMAFWGAPIENENQADGAFEAALGMLENLEELNKELKSTGKPEIRIGIGIYTGRAVVGNVGSHLRFDYTAIGDSVNTASRLEGLTKEYKTNIIIGESVKNKLKKNYNLKFLDSVIVKGKLKPVNIYGLE